MKLFFSCLVFIFIGCFEGTTDAPTVLTCLGEPMEDNEFCDERDGNIYKKVTIGNQTWMAENLRFLPRVNNGYNGIDTYLQVDTFKQYLRYYYIYGFNTNEQDSVSDLIEAKATANYTKYGVLYNWFAAADGTEPSALNPSLLRGACPEGWHLPSRAEWEVLLNKTLGEEHHSGYWDHGVGKLKSTSGWDSYEDSAGNGSDDFGFNALPAGCRHENTMVEGKVQWLAYQQIDAIALFWTATRDSPVAAHQVYIPYYYHDLMISEKDINTGSSIRCVED